MTPEQELHPWQKDALAWLRDKPYGAVFLEPRMGKTRIAVTEIRDKFAEGAWTRVLVVAPKLAATNTWAEELSNAGCPTHLLTEGTLKTRAQQIRSTERGVIVINPEVVGALKPALLAFKPDAVYVDESHLFGNHAAQRTRALTKIGDTVPVRRILTGTPTSSSYATLYSQMRFLSPDIFGKTVTGFRDKYLVMHPMWKTKIESYKDLPGLKAKVAENAFILRRADVMHIPHVNEYVRRFDLDDATRKLYDTLAREYVLEDEASHKFVDASHRLTRLSKMQQLTSGFVNDNDGNVWRQAVSTKARYAAELVEEDEAAGLKTVIFYQFTEEGRILEAHIPSAVRIYGMIPYKQRRELLDAFAKSEPGQGFSTLIMQSSMGLGFSLAHAQHAIFTSLPTRYDAYVQAKDRIFNRNEPISYSYLIARRTVDEFFLTTIRKNANIAEQVMSLNFGSILRGEQNDV